jgi:phage N-6-adenine-methyltransferase
MTLALFKPKNHPQQIATREVVTSIDERFTPDKLYREYDSRFHFTLDVAATAENTKTAFFYDREQDGLRQPWAPHRVWCNPPYSDLEPWLRKSHSARAGCPVIVMLLPSNRTEQPFWQQWIEPYRDRGGWLRTEFIAKRRNFGTPDNESGKHHSSPPFGLVAVIFVGDAGEQR